MGRQAIEQAVKDYVLSEFLPGESADSLKGTTPLITGGILDSIATIKLVSFLEKNYGIQFDAHEVSADQLDTVVDIAKIVDAKIANK